MKKLLILGIIAMFIGITFIPCCNSISIISAINKYNTKIVSIPIKIYKSNKIENHNLFLTKQQNKNLEVLIKEFKSDLIKTESIEETVEIYRNMILSLDKLKLLPNGMSINQAQNLVIGKCFDSDKTRLSSEKINIKYLQLPGSKNYTNSNCYVSGSSTNTSVIFSFFWILMNYFTFFYIGGIIHGYSYIPSYSDYPAKGWIHTNSLQDSWTYSGTFFGRIKEDYNPLSSRVEYIGIQNYVGFFYPNLYFGRAKTVKIRTVDQVI